MSVGRECLESGVHDIFNTNGTIINGYWKDFVVCFLGTNVWPHTDGYVLDGLKNIFNLYCENHDISLIKNDFVSNLIEHIKQEDYLPLINLARNSFTVGSRHSFDDNIVYRRSKLHTRKGTLLVIDMVNDGCFGYKEGSNIYEFVRSILYLISDEETSSRKE